MVFLIGQRIAMFMNCKICGRPVISFRSRVLGICSTCLMEAGVQMKTLLVVNPPGDRARWN